MSERIHDDEPDTSESVVRALLHTELPQWAHSPVEYVATSGTDNAMWRIRIDDGPTWLLDCLDDPERPPAYSAKPRHSARSMRPNSAGSRRHHAFATSASLMSDLRITGRYSTGSRASMRGPLVPTSTDANVMISRWTSPTQSWPSDAPTWTVGARGGRRQ